MARLFLVLVITSCFATVFGAPLFGCPDITAYRSDSILKSFQASKLTGLFYEHAYIDIGQVGAKCQTLNSTYNPSTDKLSMGFHVEYATGPFTMVEIYTPMNASVQGYYKKNVNQ